MHAPLFDFRQALTHLCCKSLLACRFASADGGAQPFQPQQEQQLVNALVEATLVHASSGSTQGACDAGGAWQLERLAARAALVGSKRGGGGGGEGAEESEAELQGLRLEARDAAQALLSRLQQLAASRGAHLKQLRQLAAVGEDGAPRCTPLLRQIAGELWALLRAGWGAGHSSPRARHRHSSPSSPSPPGTPPGAEHILRDQPLPDLHAGATSLSGLVRAGLGRFGLKGAGPKPSDCSTVVLFVLGAVSVAGARAGEGCGEGCSRACAAAALLVQCNAPRGRSY